MKKENIEKEEQQEIIPDELRRKIISIAKDLFLHPTEEGVEPKSKAPSKKAILTCLTSQEAEFIQKNEDEVFIPDFPERQFWDVYMSNSIEKRKDVLLRVVAEDRALQIERDLITKNEEEGNADYVPTKQEIIQKLPLDEQEILQKIKAPILSTTKALMRFSQQERKVFLLTGKLEIEEVVDTEQQELYMDYVDSQKDLFDIYMKFINLLLVQLKKYRQVHANTVMSARIKASDSALENDTKKTLDDIFGMEVAFSTEKEKKLIQEIVASTISVNKEKFHNKSNGYKAYHCTGNPCDLENSFNDTKLYKKLKERYEEEFYFEPLINNVNIVWKDYKNKMINVLRKKGQEFGIYDIPILISEFMPCIEYQFKTISKAIEAIHGPAAHFLYKKGKNGEDEELSEEEKEKLLEDYKKSIQKKYTNMIKYLGKIPLSQVPTMWESNLDGKVPRQLSTMETLKHIYPFFIDPKDLEEKNIGDDENSGGNNER